MARSPAQMAADKARREPMKGNKYAVGNNGGAPLKYTVEFCEALALKLEEWMKHPTSLYLQCFCAENGLHPDYMADFARRSEEFNRVYKLVKIWQEGKLLNNASWNICNPGFIKFVLVNHHNYRSDSAPPPSESVSQCAFKSWNGNVKPDDEPKAE